MPTPTARFSLTISNADGSGPETHPVTPAELVDAEYEPEDVVAIGALAIGDEHVMGGGAAPIFAVRRIS